MWKILFSGVFCLNFLCLPSISLSQSKGGRWQFENNAEDTATWDAVNDNGLLQNQALWGNEGPLQEGSAYLGLDSLAAHNFVKIADSEDLDFDNENIAISAWIYPTTLNDVHFVLNKGIQDENPKTTNYSLRIARNKKLEFLIRDSNNKAQKVSSSFTIPVNEWTFIAIFYDFAAGKVYMWNQYTNTAIDTIDFRQDCFSNNDPLAIGSWARNDPSSPSIKDFEGRIDDVLISGRLEDVFSGVTGISDRGRQDNSRNNFPEMSTYPNPASRSNTHITLELQYKSQNHEPVEIRVYNILGQQILQRVVYAQTNKGFLFNWNMRDSKNNPVNSGLYFFQVGVQQKCFVKKVLIVR